MKTNLIVNQLHPKCIGKEEDDFACVEFTGWCGHITLDLKL